MSRTRPGQVRLGAWSGPRQLAAPLGELEVPHDQQHAGGEEEEGGAEHCTEDHLPLPLSLLRLPGALLRRGEVRRQPLPLDDEAVARGAAPPAQPDPHRVWLGERGSRILGARLSAGREERAERVAEHRDVGKLLA